MACPPPCPKRGPVTCLVLHKGSSSISATVRSPPRHIGHTTLGRPHGSQGGTFCQLQLPWGIAGCDGDPNLVWLRCQEEEKTPGVAGAASPWLAGATQSYSTKPSVRNAEQQTHGVNHITEPSVGHSTKIVEDVAKAVQMNSEAVVILGHRLEQAVCNMSQVVQLSSSVTQNLALSTQSMAMTSSGMFFSR